MPDSLEMGHIYESLASHMGYFPLNSNFKYSLKSQYIE